ncbi:twin-arginine translocase subunit TatB [Sphingomonas panacisoli]|uniref:Twin-arginine translocase subunit TatB n=1 Tax=Sphingomonas panacisoli TaxID=1813879 RepID=A0A5B8LM29_9SPHN|nr:Sec-independent protein translocase protein TatB [Sphingomonas panacisoli]QDZ09163.1 twin-arginine translocase subunit TatB [Sphingomonas panacisoli]
MFDIAPTELLVLGAVALVVIPPKDLPKAMRLAGQWIGRARGMARQFRSGFDDMIRESEFQEMEKKWKAENERIMREFPATPDQAMLMAPVPQDDSTPESEDALAMTTEMAPVEATPAPKRKTPAKPRAAAARKPTAKKPAAKRAKP